MNGRERILAAFRGETPDYIPFAPNIYLWFYYHQFNHSLPPELADASHPLDIVRYLGGDILARWDLQASITTHYSAGEYSDEFGGWIDWNRPLVTAFNVFPPNRCERHQKFVTPYGTLTQFWRYSPDAGADYEAKHWWTDWSEYEAIRFMVEAHEYDYDPTLYPQWAKKIGNDGIMMIPATHSPLKALHWLAGAQNATLFLIDHPQEMKALAKIHAEKSLALLEKVADQSGADIFISSDNLDSAFHPPRYYREISQEYYARAAEIVHRRGKIFIVHACGRSKAILPLVGADGIDCLEGLTPPPLGDVQLGDVRRLAGSDHFTVNGGMDTHHLEVNQHAEAEIHAYTQWLFNSMGDRRHFIFASSCATTPNTPWQNLVYFRDAAREYGIIS